MRAEWPEVSGATRYEIARDVDIADGANSFITVHTIDNGAATGHTFTNLRLVDALHHTYRVRACIDQDCSKQASAPVTGSLAEAANVISGPGVATTSQFGRAMSTASGVPVVNGQNSPSQWLAVGAPAVGRVHIYARPTSGGVWTLLQTLANTDSQTADDFGASVSFSPDGMWLAVGVPGDSKDGAGIEPVSTGKPMGGSGAVRVFRRVAVEGGYEWQRWVNIKAFNPGVADAFGAAVSILDYGLLAVGAPFEDSAATGSHPAPDSADDPLLADASPAVGEDFGAVYYYYVDGFDPLASRNLTYLKPQAASATAASGATFGATLAQSNNTYLAVGAPRASLLTANAGAVQVFVLNGQNGAWEYQASLYPQAAVAASSDQGFGAALSLNADASLLAVGYPGKTGAFGIRQGAAYLYRRAVDEWRPVPPMQPDSTDTFANVSPTPAAYDRFGMSVALGANGSTPLLLIGNWGDGANHAGLQRAGEFAASTDLSKGDSGGAFYYELLNGAWVAKARMKASQPQTDERMGRAVAVTRDGSEMLMGAERGTTVVGY